MDNLIDFEDYFDPTVYDNPPPADYAKQPINFKPAITYIEKRLGIEVSKMSLAAKYPTGIYIEHIQEWSALYKAGLRAGYLLTEIKFCRPDRVMCEDNVRLRSLEDLWNFIQKHLGQQGFQISLCNEDGVSINTPISFDPKKYSSSQQAALN